MAPREPLSGIAPLGGETLSATESGALRRAGEPTEGFVDIEGGRHYRIPDFDSMPPFLMSLATDTDLWMFVTSGGGLTAGRVDPDGSLFPYETVDKLHDAHHHSGPITLFRVRRGSGDAAFWEPFRDRGGKEPGIRRHLYKNTIGNRLVFEEANEELDLVFRYRWAGCDEFGWVRTASLENRGPTGVAVEMLDGLRNVLPWGAPLALYQRSSSLVDAYRRTDCDPATGLAVFSLTSLITDRAEPAEMLRANSVWCHGLRGFTVSLSAESIDTFRRGEPVPAETVLTGRRGNYLVRSSLELGPGGRADWWIAADVGRSHVQLAALQSRLRSGSGLGRTVRAALRAADENLARIVAGADGAQLTADGIATVHHSANVLFNCMRGGVFANNYDVPVADLGSFLRTRNREVAARKADLLGGLPETVPASELIREAGESGDVDFERLCYEYLPLWFGRRHGDPSRPWNRFSLRVSNPDGGRVLNYEGNWRDIFQNWEALGMSFPDFLPGMVAKFVNASTMDGFNPYRITRDGIDWEVIDPRDPWSYIGYWGDHQIVYLLRLLEAWQRFSPGTLDTMLDREIFSYADVPYRLKPYDAMLENPRRTIVYDAEHAGRVAARVRALGTDGKLVAGADGSVRHVSLLEKLLVPALSKLSNLVPDGGIWMNTQRPEWNDANNALAGNGVSMVTLYHLRRYVAFLEERAGKAGDRTTPVTRAVVAWLGAVHQVLAGCTSEVGAAAPSDIERRRVLDDLGSAFSAYREEVYHRGPSAAEPLAMSEVAAFCRTALVHLDRAIRANRRGDGLYHAYNLLEVDATGSDARIRRLPVMLEGQVAALSSGLVDPPEAVAMIAALFASPLYRGDQGSFMLYPERRLPSFLERNVVPEDGVRSIPLLVRLLDAGDGSILERDAAGTYRFHGDFHNQHDLEGALDRLGERIEWRDAAAEDRAAVLALFEAVFDHHAFTGRSGTMYGYEGLGCIYWHMVAKLLLAVQEITLRAFRETQPPATRDALVAAYYRIRAGLGFGKTASEYGAFPTDPYSHTPAHAGAQQPGMTGQVKEEILTRFGELGVRVEGGSLAFRPVLLRRKEFLVDGGDFRYVDLDGVDQSIELPPGALAFTFCQVPVVYRLTGEDASVRVVAGDGSSEFISGDILDPEASQAVFSRSGRVSRIEVSVPGSILAGI